MEKKMIQIKKIKRKLFESNYLLGLILTSMTFAMFSSVAVAQAQQPGEKMVSPSNIPQEHPYPNYSLTDNRVLEFERMYLESTQCLDSCGAVVGLEIKKFDESTGIVDLVLNYSANKKTLLPILLSQNDFDILSVTHVQNSQNVPLLKKDKIYFLAQANSAEDSIRIVAKKKTSSQNTILTDSPIRVVSVANNVSVQNTRNQFSINFAAPEKKEIAVDDKKPEVLVKNDIKTNASYILERVIVLDTKWRMTTTLRPVISNRSSSEVLEFKVPLINGEKILTSAIESNDNVVNVKIKTGDSFSWTSEINPNNTLSVPSANGQFTQLVRMLSKDSWEINPSETGLKPVEINSDRVYKNGYSWFMWSNESLDTNVSIYKYVDGQVLAVSDLEISVDMNTLPTQAVMNFKVNSSIGGIYKFKNKNKDFKIVDLSINQAKMQSDVKNDEVSLMLKPGINNVVINFTYTPEDSFIFKAPEFDFNTQVMNASLKVQDGKNWVLYAGGADIKPSVLLWSVLVTLFIFSFIVFKSGSIGLSFISTALLLFGISQVGIDFVIFSLLWFFMIKFRMSNTMEDFKTYFRFNAFQFFFALLTVFVISGMISVVAKGLLLTPESFIAGYQSSFTSLYWYSQDYATQQTPWLLTAPIWVYRVLMMVWAVWLAFNMLNWLKSCWIAFSNNGFWYKKPKTTQPIQDLKEVNPKEDLKEEKSDN